MMWVRSRLDKFAALFLAQVSAVNEPTGWAILPVIRAYLPRIFSVSASMRQHAPALS
jgi:hypothetical protein